MLTYHCRALRRGIIPVLVVLSLWGCGGSGGGGSTTSDSQSSAGTSVDAGGSSGSGGTGSGSSSGSSSGGSSSGGGSSGGSSSGGGSSGGGTTGNATILFTQPQETGIAHHLVVPTATHTAPPAGVFTLVLWQPNPSNPSGQLVPTAWDASSLTGFSPATTLIDAQLGFQNKPGTSTAQMDDDAVGAYINSQDLSPSSTEQKMMITPQFIFAAGSAPMPFAGSSASLGGSMDLQIPTAVGSDTYVVADLLFEGPNGVRISYGVEIFHNGTTNPIVSSGYDAPSNSYMLNSPLGIDQRFVSMSAGSGTATGSTWLGWRPFGWSISRDQFGTALNYLISQFPGAVTSTDPSQYSLIEIHLNAEFHFLSNPAELGWSMRGLTLWTSG